MSAPNVIKGSVEISCERQDSAACTLYSDGGDTMSAFRDIINIKPSVDAWRLRVYARKHGREMKKANPKWECKHAIVANTRPKEKVLPSSMKRDVVRSLRYECNPCERGFSL